MQSKNYHHYKTSAIAILHCSFYCRINIVHIPLSYDKVNTYMLSYHALINFPRTLSVSKDESFNVPLFTKCELENLALLRTYPVTPGQSL